MGLVSFTKMEFEIFCQAWEWSPQLGVFEQACDQLSPSAEQGAQRHSHLLCEDVGFRGPTSHQGQQPVIHFRKSGGINGRDQKECGDYPNNQTSIGR